jgi:hypothetical protein
MGSESVFFRPGEELKVDIAASVVLDLSGSMNEERPKLRDSSIVTQVAMEKMQIPHEIWGYSGSGGSHTCEHYEYKSFARDNARGLGRIGNNHDDVAPGGGSTPTKQAVDFSTARLRQRREENRVMFVFTDGFPDDQQGTTIAVQNAKRKGITVLGILFEGGNPYYSENEESKKMMETIFGGDYVVIDDLSSMPRQIGKRLKSLLKIKR